MNDRFVKLLQRRIASTSIAPSTARGMGPKGTIQAARKFLAGINLRRLHVESADDFDRVLNRLTNRLVSNLPSEASHWGAARKFLNIFLRGIFYNRFLCEKYDIYHLEPWLEVPLDSHVGKGLRLERGGNKLPRWRKVIALTPEVSTAYQKFASEVAKRKSTYRVHLDLLYWRGEHVSNSLRIETS